ncbi:hypothetical protein KOI35_17675 [Actinoplanes bogorensis]|uniref:Uncharacterized protein n=1 Tax=Paractinoplanes bogorensis TaxID=1610840 RepID=A0ABS5YPF7_9ACTN|nr:hypothetical protein [Actinoplanes bogorensis]MBU2665338.1 hypothetical protein [Actinoplanes bogorensis]
MTTTTRLLWLLITVLASSLAGVAGGLLAHLSGENLPAAIVAGAVTFAGAEGLLLGVLGFAMASFRSGGRP